MLLSCIQGGVLDSLFYVNELNICHVKCCEREKESISTVEESPKSLSSFFVKPLCRQMWVFSPSQWILCDVSAVILLELLSRCEHFYILCEGIVSKISVTIQETKVRKLIWSRNGSQCSSVKCWAPSLSFWGVVVTNPESRSSSAGYIWNEPLVITVLANAPTLNYFKPPEGYATKTKLYWIFSQSLISDTHSLVPRHCLQ